MRSLYRWHPGESDLLSTLILNLKGPGTKSGWNYYANQFMAFMLETLPTNKHIRIVPAPARRANMEDHAYNWGEALAHLIGAEFMPCLRKSTSVHQRGAARGERALLEMELLEKYSDLSTDSTEILWVFVDDILTTGATARAAHKALGSPSHFEVWVFARRSLSCGASKDLL
ncbi:hypothetical protein [Bdellovibrio bacteriovorus]|uniref:hypothetical protein n=1 Tax=Bdellovibrio bacteriovorus TaxID=959 RepID=UPI0035A613C0